MEHSPLRTTILLLTFFFLMMRAHASLPIRILTHNIRYAANPQAPGEEPWSIRKHYIINELRFNTQNQPEAFICLQEVLHEQLLDIHSTLNNGVQEWAHIGVGRDDGKEEGEYSPILYRPTTWDLRSSQTVWLNEDGAVGKRGWDAASIRIVTIGVFRHKQSKKTVVGFCTHFDDSGYISRRESARLVLKLIDYHTSSSSSSSGNGTPQSNTNHLPFFLAGDLNSEPSGEAYQILNSEQSAARDAKELAQWRYGNEVTFTDFDESGCSLIDFVFVGPRGEKAWEVRGYSVLGNRFDDGVYGSDHRAVVVDGALEV